MHSSETQVKQDSRVMERKRERKVTERGWGEGGIRDNGLKGNLGMYCR